MAEISEVEKLERLLLSSCTDLRSEARNMHHAYPVVPRSAESEGEAVSKSLSNHQFRRSSRSRSRKGYTNKRRTPNTSSTELKQSNSRVKHAFLKVYGSLMSFGEFGERDSTADELNNNSTIEKQKQEYLEEKAVVGGSSADELPLPLPLSPRKKMSKEEFIEKFNTLVSEVDEKTSDTSADESPAPRPTRSRPGVSRRLREHETPPATAPGWVPVPPQVSQPVPSSAVPLDTIVVEALPPPPPPRPATPSSQKTSSPFTLKSATPVPVMSPANSKLGQVATSSKGKPREAEPSSSNRMQKVVIIGLFVLVLFGIAKATATTGTTTKPRYFR